MSHFVEGLIGRRKEIDDVKKDFEHAHAVALNEDYSLLPLTHDFLVELQEKVKTPPSDHTPPGEWFKLTPQLIAIFGKLAKGRKLAYFETNYFVGGGNQGACAWNDGELVFKPIWEWDAINNSLRHIGVVKNADLDEFDTVGLSRHRLTEDWLKDKYS